MQIALSDLKFYSMFFGGEWQDYAKTDGLEYICPHCSIANFKKKSQKNANGY
jgi:hypothetical protein